MPVHELGALVLLDVNCAAEVVGLKPGHGPASA
jgi:hypothetical protein